MADEHFYRRELLMSNIYVTTTHYYKGFTGQHIEYFGHPGDENYRFTYEPAPAKGSILVSVNNGVGRVNVHRGDSWFLPREEHSLTSLSNGSGKNTAVPVSGYFASLDEAEVHVAVGQFAVAIDNGLLKLAARKSNGSFDVLSYELSVHTTQTGSHWVELHDLPKPTGVFGPVAAEGVVVGLDGGPVHAAVAPVVLPAVTPVQAGDNPGDSINDFNGGGAYYARYHRGRRR